ncbi:MAG: hypothetical protein PVSMB9_11180 [Candidatus Dormibacteria bacterium]
METLRALPSVHQVLEQPEGVSLTRQHGRSLTLFAVQAVLDSEREAGLIESGTSRWAKIESTIERLRKPRLRRCINATGVILHTNLGRAPLPEAAAAAAASISRGYATLEINVESGKRGLRHDAVSAMLTHLTGAEEAAVVTGVTLSVDGGLVLGT